MTVTRLIWTRPVAARASDRGQARPGSADSDGLERAGDALNKEVTSHTKMYLANRPYIRDTHTVDAKASPAGAGSCPTPGRGRGRALRREGFTPTTRQAQSRDGRRRADAAPGPALDLAYVNRLGSCVQQRNRLAASHF